MAAGSGDLAQLAGWAAKLDGATCRLAGLLHLAGHLRDGWARPIGANTLADAVLLADYLIEHARAVFDLLGARPPGRRRPLAARLDQPDQPHPVHPPRRHAAAPAAASAKPPTWSQPLPC